MSKRIPYETLIENNRRLTNESYNWHRAVYALLHPSKHNPAPIRTGTISKTGRYVVRLSDMDTPSGDPTVLVTFQKSGQRDWHAVFGAQEYRDRLREALPAAGKDEAQLIQTILTGINDALSAQARKEHAEAAAKASVLATV